MLLAGHLLLRTPPLDGVAVGDVFSFRVHNKRAALEAADGDRVLPEDEGSLSSRLLQALGRVAKSEGLSMHIHVVGASSTGVNLQVDVFLPTWLWQAGHSWCRSPASAMILQHLHPVSGSHGGGTQASAGGPAGGKQGQGQRQQEQAEEQGQRQQEQLQAVEQGQRGKQEQQEERRGQVSMEVEEQEWGLAPSYLEALALQTAVAPTVAAPAAADSGEGQQGAAEDPFSLAACFVALPTKMSDPALPPVARADPSSPSLLADLPLDVLLRVLSKLDSASLKRAASACRHLRAAAMDVPPGLKLSLFPHQRAAVRWMLEREAPPRPIPHPTIREFSAIPSSPSGPAAAGGTSGQPPMLPFWGNTSTGEIVVEEPPPVMDFRGGLFCDEPGLGKTITGLGLILKTQGLLPSPPAGAPMTWMASEPTGHGLPQGPRRGYYTLADAAAGSASTLQAARSRGARGVGGQGPMRRTRSASAALSQSMDDAGAEESAGAGWELGGGARSQETSAPSAGGQAAAEEEEEEEEEQRQQQGRPKRQRTGLGEGGVAPPFALSAAPTRWSQGAQSMSSSLASMGSMPSMGLGSQQGGYSEEGEEGAAPSVQAGPLWVECHLCKKWRKVPPSYPVPEGEWVCSSTASLGEDWRRSCRDPQDEDEQSALVQSCPGWVGADEEGGSDSNVVYFRSLLAQQPSLAADSASALHWLARQPPQVLLKGLTIPTKSRAPVHYGEVLVQLGLVPVKKGAGGGKQRGRGGQAKGGWSDEEEGAAGKKGRAGGPKLAVGRGAGKQDWFSWRQGAPYKFLRLDTTALALALGAGPQGALHRVYLSPATLVVVTPELIDHWMQQLERHVTRHALRVAVVVSDGSPYGDAGNPRTPWELAWECDLVITTFDYMSHKWDARAPITCTPLMQVHWLRVILDEGHKIGGLAMTNKLQMATALQAERRWVMTGTPTPSSGGATPVGYLQPLLAFLHEHPYGSQLSTWQEGVQVPFQARQLEGRLRLLALLQRCMIRASKAELWNLPRLHRTVTLLDFAPMHAQSYNGFVDIVRFNLLTSDWYDPDHLESLLCERNTRRAAQTFRNLRLSCNVAGNCELQVLEKDLAETVWLLTAKHALPPPPPPAAARHLAACRVALEEAVSAAGDEGERALAGMALHFLSKMEDGEGESRHISVPKLLPCLERGEVPLRVLRPLLRTLCAVGTLPLGWAQRAARVEHAMQSGAACERCGEAARVVFAVPCGHLLCVDCTSRDAQACPHCGQLYVMQSKDDPDRLKHNPRPKWDVPVELIEWQPAYAQKGAHGVTEGEWQANWQITQSTKCVHLLRRLREAGAALSPGAEGQRLREQMLAGGGGGQGRREHKGLSKAIVFTQFWEQQLLLHHYLEGHGVAHAVLKSSMKPQEKSSELYRFQHSLWCGVLLMDESGSVGLDLSFVSHIFIMEPIADLALEQQVVSRAHRMGAKHDVLVETLGMRSTLEEYMLRQQSQQGAERAQQAEQAGGQQVQHDQQAPPAPRHLTGPRPAGDAEGSEGVAAAQPSTGDALAVAAEASGRSGGSGGAGQPPPSPSSSPRPGPGSPGGGWRKRRVGVLDWSLGPRRHQKGPSSSPSKKQEQPEGQPVARGAAGGAGGRGLRSGQQERQRTEADRRRARNQLLLSLRPVKVAELAEFKDLPGGQEEEEEASPWASLLAPQRLATFAATSPGGNGGQSSSVGAQAAGVLAGVSSGVGPTGEQVLPASSAAVALLGGGLSARTSLAGAAGDDGGRGSGRAVPFMMCGGGEHPPVASTAIEQHGGAGSAGPSNMRLGEALEGPEGMATLGDGPPEGHAGVGTCLGSQGRREAPSEPGLCPVATSAAGGQGRASARQGVAEPSHSPSSAAAGARPGPATAGSTGAVGAACSPPPQPAGACESPGGSRRDSAGSAAQSPWWVKVTGMFMGTDRDQPAPSNHHGSTPGREVKGASREPIAEGAGAAIAVAAPGRGIDGAVAVAAPTPLESVCQEPAGQQLAGQHHQQHVQGDVGGAQGEASEGPPKGKARKVVRFAE